MCSSTLDISIYKRSSYAVNGPRLCNNRVLIRYNHYTCYSLLRDTMTSSDDVRNSGNISRSPVPIPPRITTLRVTVDQQQLPASYSLQNEQECNPYSHFPHLKPREETSDHNRPPTPSHQHHPSTNGHQPFLPPRSQRPPCTSRLNPCTAPLTTLPLEIKCPPDSSPDRNGRPALLAPRQTV